MEGERGPDIDALKRQMDQWQKQMSRREFMAGAVNKVAAVSAPTLIASLLGPLAWEWGQNNWNEKQLDAEIGALKNEMQTTYGVKASIAPGDFPLEDMAQTSKIFTKEIASRYVQFKSLEGLQDVLNVYPPQLIQKHVKEIRITNNLVREGPLGTDYSTAGTIDFEKKLVIVDVLPLFQSYMALLGTMPPRSTTHHEIAHLVCEEISEKEWETLHPGVKYLSFFARGVRDADVPAGFIRAHSMTSVAEDIATVAETVFLPGSYYSYKLKDDQIVKAKASYTKNWYQKESDGLMDDQYWLDLANSKVGKGYWQERQRS